MLQQARRLRRSLQADAEPSLPNPARVLSVVREVEQRRMEALLDYQRERVVSLREQALDRFTDHHGITAEQRSALQTLLLDESDRMFEIMGGRRMREHPAAAAQELKELAERVDEEGNTLLTPQQQKAWMHGRKLERTVLMPWLP